MGWDVALDGTLEFADAAALAQFRAAPIANAPELEAAASPFDGGIAAGTVDAWLTASCDAAFSVQSGDSALSLRGVWTEDTFRDLGSGLALVVATAARMGGRGEIVLVGLGPEIAYLLVAEKSGARVAELSERDHARLYQKPWVVDAIDMAAKSFQAMMPPPSKVGLEVIDLAFSHLEALDDDALFACAKDLPPGVTVRLEGKPIDEAWAVPTVAFPTGAALHAALFPEKKPRVRPDWQICFALPALAVHDPSLAEPLAVQVVTYTEADHDLRASAAHALGRCATARAVDTLFALLDRPVQAEYALARNGFPGIAVRALEALDERAIDELFAATGYAGYLSTRGARLVQLLGMTKHAPALEPLLAAWYRRGKSQAAGLIGYALIGLRHPRGLEAVALSIDEPDPAAARMGARAFLLLDPSTAYDRADRFFASDDPDPARGARALLEALAADANPLLPTSDGLLAADSRWIARARGVESPPLVRSAAELVLRVAEHSPSRQYR